MYFFLESISEFLDRFSLVIVGGMMGILVMGLLWRKVPKPEHPLRKDLVKIEKKAKAISKVLNSTKHRMFSSSLFIALFIWIWILIAFFGILTYIAAYYPHLLLSKVN